MSVNACAVISRSSVSSPPRDRPRRGTRRGAATAATSPAMVQATLGVLLAQLRSLDTAIDELERAIVADHRRDPVSRLAVERPRRRRARRFGDSGQRARSARLQIRPRFRRLAWRDAQAELDRREGEIRVDNQTGQSLYPTATGVGRHLDLAGGAKRKGPVVDWLAALRARKSAKVWPWRSPTSLPGSSGRSSPPARRSASIHLRQGLIRSRGDAFEKKIAGSRVWRAQRRRDERHGETIETKDISAMGQEPKARPLD